MNPPLEDDVVDVADVVVVGSKFSTELPKILIKIYKNSCEPNSYIKVKHLKNMI